MEIPDIKQNLSILKVLAHYNLIPDRNHLLNCPFHEDKTASLQVYPKTNTYHCFGCGKTGDAIQWIEDYEKVSKHEAILKAQGLAGLGKAAEEETTVYKNENYTGLFALFLEGIERSENAKRYCNGRGLDYKALKPGYNSGKLYNKLKNCIIFPLKDRQGNITSFYGRSIINNENAKHYYTANRKGLYPNYPTPGTTKLILTEAIIDCATLLQVSEGCSTAVASEEPKAKS